MIHAEHIAVCGIFELPTWWTIWVEPRGIEEMHHLVPSWVLNPIMTGRMTSFPGSIMVRTSAPHAENPGSIPGQGALLNAVYCIVHSPRFFPFSKNEGKRKGNSNHFCSAIEVVTSPAL